MIKNRGVVICVGIVLLIIASFCLDNFVAEKIVLLRGDFLDSFFLFLVLISSEVILFVLLTSLFLWTENKRRWIFPLWLCFGVSAFISFILKATIQRLRPFQTGIVSILPKLIEESHSIWNFSFPSSHSMLAFCAVPLLSEQFPRLKKWFIAFAVLIAFSRMYLGLHFLSDVLVGAFIGYLIGLVIVKREKDNQLGKRIYNKIFKR
jgi:undecaprenyl-diphosphatase